MARPPAFPRSSAPAFEVIHAVPIVGQELKHLLEYFRRLCHTRPMYKLFSVDDHIIEPAHVWSSRVPAKYRAAAPHVVEEDGREYWVYEDRRNDTMGLNAVAGKPREEWSLEPTRFTDMIPGCYDPVARAADMRSQGIFASVNFPTLPRFGGALFSDLRGQGPRRCLRAGMERLRARRVVRRRPGDVRADGDLPAVGPGPGRGRDPSLRGEGGARRCASSRTRARSVFRRSTTLTIGTRCSARVRRPTSRCACTSGRRARARRDRRSRSIRTRPRSCRSPPRSPAPRVASINMMLSPDPAQVPRHQAGVVGGRHRLDPCRARARRPAVGAAPLVARRRSPAVGVWRGGTCGSA